MRESQDCFDLGRGQLFWVLGGGASLLSSNLLCAEHLCASWHTGTILNGLVLALNEALQAQHKVLRAR